MTALKHNSETKGFLMDKAKRAKKTAKPARKVKIPKAKSEKPVSIRGGFPRHTLEKALRIPSAILEQNAGKACTPQEAAKYVGVLTVNGPLGVEIASAKKYGFLESPETGKIQTSALAKMILRPKNESDVVRGYRDAVLKAPSIGDVYLHFRGENLPDDRFLINTLSEQFGISEDQFADFKQVFLDCLSVAELVEKRGDKIRVLDSPSDSVENDSRIKSLGKGVVVNPSDSCFVMQPFSSPLGTYYASIYKPAIEKAGLKAVRADTDIFGTGKIIDQVWRGISEAKVLVAELTSRNPNVFYELGLAHALNKPVVLISASEDDVPFDLRHIRVIYYDHTDPFWGNKLLEKVAENILSALRNPEEALFKPSQIS